MLRLVFIDLDYFEQVKLIQVEQYVTWRCHC